MRHNKSYNNIIVRICKKVANKCDYYRCVRSGLAKYFECPKSEMDFVFWYHQDLCHINVKRFLT